MHTQTPPHGPRGTSSEAIKRNQKRCFFYFENICNISSNLQYGVWKRGVKKSHVSFIGVQGENSSTSIAFTISPFPAIKCGAADRTMSRASGELIFHSLWVSSSSPFLGTESISRERRIRDRRKRRARNAWRKTLAVYIIKSVKTNFYLNIRPVCLQSSFTLSGCMSCHVFSEALQHPTKFPPKKAETTPDFHLITISFLGKEYCAGICTANISPLMS